MNLSGLYLYPIKSTAALAVREAAVEAQGLANDRRWMVVNPAGRFVTGRELARLTLVRARPVAEGLVLEAPGMPSLAVATPDNGRPVDATVWDSTVAARGADPAADAWLSDFLLQPVRLVHMGPDSHRTIDEPQARADDTVSFADGYPLLLISQASLDGLNARLPQPVPMLRFRPNLVVGGADAPHAEDHWRRVRVGEVEFDVVKTCTRCVFTTVDPQRGERDPGGEPLRTLASYRRSDKGITFGQNLIPRSAGTVRAGDPVEVLARA
ncbi:MOSC domain-containing protein [Agrilutibacter solisilvae]|uniref:MOSC domain-containing protein n=1 Tax=Agrilutibacter solisilvae TaxID=2763317 RepID=A0A974XXW7_9GAMM|nr:MOSC domain-containing protein [Lysobacter solisilvae]QSX76970.1 MOSC domain-containing protein [Lysobacter solisilvae]